MSSKVYNIKESDIGKISFQNDAILSSVKFKVNDSFKGETMIFASLEEGSKKTVQWFYNILSVNLPNYQQWKNDTILYIINNWNIYVEDIKNKYQKDYGLETNQEFSLEQWMNQEETIFIVIIELALKANKGVFKTPYNVFFYVKFIRNLIGVNFWEN